MNQIPNPDNWMDVLTILAAVAMVALPSWIAAVRNHQGIKDIKNQVVNGHTSPMRADLDRAITAVENLATDVRGLRQDLALEETRRRSAVADLYSELDHRTGRHRKEEY